MDAIYILISAVMAAATWGLIALCDRLGGGGS